jgi:hypothetical protein
MAKISGGGETDETLCVTGMFNRRVDLAGSYCKKLQDCSGLPYGEGKERICSHRAYSRRGSALDPYSDVWIVCD